ncbi:hypothetical protein HRbin08_00048 [bacterium HR08]|nr:hypothetical protein HRbin08_00048 [bacterium HR08]
MRHCEMFHRASLPPEGESPAMGIKDSRYAWQGWKARGLRLRRRRSEIAGEPIAQDGRVRTSHQLRASWRVALWTPMPCPVRLDEAYVCSHGPWTKGETTLCKSPAGSKQKRIMAQAIGQRPPCRRALLIFSDAVRAHRHRAPPRLRSTLRSGAPESWLPATTPNAEDGAGAAGLSHSVLSLFGPLSGELVMFLTGDSLPTLSPSEVEGTRFQSGGEGVRP